MEIEEGLYNQCSENKGADQLRGYHGNKQTSGLVDVMFDCSLGRLLNVMAELVDK